jgi:hypothetical protein
VGHSHVCRTGELARDSDASKRDQRPTVDDDHQPARADTGKCPVPFCVTLSSVMNVFADWRERLRRTSRGSCSCRYGLSVWELTWIVEGTRRGYRSEPAAEPAVTSPTRQRLPSSLVIEGVSAFACRVLVSNLRRDTSDER